MYEDGQYMENIFFYDIYGISLMSNVPIPGYEMSRTLGDLDKSDVILSWYPERRNSLLKSENLIGSNGYVDCYGTQYGKLLYTPDLCIEIEANSVKIFSPCEHLREALLIFVNAGIVLCLYMRGFLVLHASAACNKDSLLAFTSGSGGGKSTLCFYLVITNGMCFFGDDIVPVRIEGESVYAYPVNSGNPKAEISITQNVPMDRMACRGISYAYDDVEFYFHLSDQIKQNKKRKLDCLYVLESTENGATCIVDYEDSSVSAKILASCHSTWALTRKEKVLLVVRSRKIAESIRVSELRYERVYERLPEVYHTLLWHIQGIR